ncbi:CPBP family intramembrane glutamic endopeptidase, partial [Ruminococcus sp.]
MIANVATSVIADNFSLFGIENTSSGLTSGDSSVLSIVLNIISTAIVPAFAEEFAFRGIVMGSLRKFGDTVAIIG